MTALLDFSNCLNGVIFGIFLGLGGLVILNVLLRVLGFRVFVLHIPMHDEKSLKKLDEIDSKIVKSSHDLTPILEALQELQSQALESLKKDLEKQEQTLESIKDQTKPFDPPLPTRASIDAASHKLPTLSRKAESTSHITHLLDSRAYPPHTPPPFDSSTPYLSI